MQSASSGSAPEASSAPASGPRREGVLYQRRDGIPDILELQRIAKFIRRDIVQMTAEAASGHPGGSLSAVELLTALYFCVLRHDPHNPRWPERDRFILSKAHACPVLYSVLARCGYFPVEELKTFRKINSRLQGHAHIMTPGVEMSGGSLGQGLSFGIGVALAGRLDARAYRVYVLLGDGECEEGQVWEAAMAASHYRLDNLTAVVDRNGIQNDRFTSQVMALEPLADKWRAFGWHVLEVEGHDSRQVLQALEAARAIRGKPTVVIARTVKGRGVSFMENNPDFHGRAPNKEELAQALKELGE
ncbi:MAG: transketolase [Chloroflexi bacterium]|nr:transketolase [Chloroflexota bacterium]